LSWTALSEEERKRVVEGDAEHFKYHLRNCVQFICGMSSVEPFHFLHCEAMATILQTVKK